MPSDPLVSVITVTYNSSSFVRDAIESILASTYQNLQLVVGDDSSTDTTWAIINGYNDPRIRKYRNDKNIGEYKNRNKAIECASGEYLIFIDGDDMIYPHGLEFLIRKMEHHPECGMALMYPYVNWMYLPVVISPRDFYLSNFFHKGFNDIAFANTLFRTKILKHAGGLPMKYISGDIYVRLKIAATHPTLIVQDQLTWWRETPGQASEKLKNDPNSVMQNFKLHSQIIGLKEIPLDSAEKQKALENELYKVRMRIYHCIRRLKVNQLKKFLTLLLRNGLFFSLVTAKRNGKNPFSEFSPSFPLRSRADQII